MRLGFIGFNRLEMDCLLAGLRFRSGHVLTMEEKLPVGLELDAVTATDAAWQAWCSGAGAQSSNALHVLPWIVMTTASGPLRPVTAFGVEPYKINIGLQATSALTDAQRWLNQRIGLPGVHWPQRNIRERSEFSNREHDVMALLTRGLSNEQIAEQLGLRVPTVKTYLRRIFERTGALNRAHAVALYSDRYPNGQSRITERSNSKEDYRLG